MRLASGGGARTPVAQKRVQYVQHFRGQYVGGVTALMIAAAACPTCIDLLLARSVNINATDRQGMTALMVAAQNGQPVAMRRLLDAGADPSLKDQGGRSYLDWANASTR